MHKSQPNQGHNTWSVKKKEAVDQLIISYDNGTGKVFFPNKEILDEFKTSTADDAWASVFESFQASEKLLEAIWAKDEDAVAEALEKAHVYS